MNLKLVALCECNSQAVMDYRDEFINNSEVMHGSACLDEYNDFDAYYNQVLMNAHEDTVQAGYVPASLFLAFDDSDYLVGMIHIRHRLNEFLLEGGGHIGYSVRKSQRRKGYASQMLQLALLECQKLGIKRCLITCDKVNVASAKTILKNGGVLENEITMKDNENEVLIVQRYWIDLKS